MKIFTHTCPDCGTIVAGNILEERREMKCPRTNCDAILRFSDLPEAARTHLEEHRDRYEI